MLIRLMAGGRLVPPAAAEITALPPGTYERTVAEPVLLHFQHLLEQDTARPLDPHETEFLMIMCRSWDDAKAEGRAEGRAAERAEILRKQLGLKFGSIPAEIEQRIQAASPEELDRYVERVLFADSIAAVFA